MGTRRRAVGLAGLLLGTAVALTACGHPAGGPGGGMNPSFSASPLQPSESLHAPPATGPGGSPGKPGQLTVRGHVVDGVEAGCMLLQADDGQSYLLLGGDRTTIASGGRLEVVGKLAVGIASYCQQGTPFQVSSVRKL